MLHCPEDQSPELPTIHLTKNPHDSDLLLLGHWSPDPDPELNTLEPRAPNCHPAWIAGGGGTSNTLYCRDEGMRGCASWEIPEVATP